MVAITSGGGMAWGEMSFTRMPYRASSGAEACARPTTAALETGRGGPHGVLHTGGARRAYDAALDHGARGVLGACEHAPGVNRHDAVEGALVDRGQRGRRHATADDAGVFEHASSPPCCSMAAATSQQA
ncbi:hypothetical protein SEVIR_6G144350v4 [Setaria viridis]